MLVTYLNHQLQLYISESPAADMLADVCPASLLACVCLQLVCRCVPPACPLVKNTCEQSQQLAHWCAASSLMTYVLLQFAHYVIKNIWAIPDELAYWCDASSWCIFIAPNLAVKSQINIITASKLLHIYLLSYSLSYAEIYVALSYSQLYCCIQLVAHICCWRLQLLIFVMLQIFLLITSADVKLQLALLDCNYQRYAYFKYQLQKLIDQSIYLPCRSVCEADEVNSGQGLVILINLLMKHYLISLPSG